MIAPASLSALADQLSDRAELPREWLGLGTIDLTPMTLVVVADADGFARWARGRVPRWGAGLTVASRRLIVIRADAGDPVGTLTHELAHLALHSRIRSRVPLWFSEGYAVVASGEQDRLAALQLNLAVALGRVPSLGGLDAALRGGMGDAAAAYALAGEAVADIARRHPQASLAPILERLQNGESWESALTASTGLDPDRFGELWQQGLRKRYNLAIWAATGGAWLVLALALGFLAAQRKRRDAPRRAALDVGWPLPDPDPENSEADDETMVNG